MDVQVFVGLLGIMFIFGMACLAVVCASLWPEGRSRVNAKREKPPVEPEHTLMSLKDLYALEHEVLDHDEEALAVWNHADACATCNRTRRRIKAKHAEVVWKSVKAAQAPLSGLISLPAGDYPYESLEDHRERVRENEESWNSFLKLLAI